MYYYNEFFDKLNRLDESYELEETFQTHGELNQQLFDQHLLREDVRRRLVEIADLFIEDIKEQNIPIDVIDYWLLGSNAAYNYGPKSDIDIHIIVNMEDLGVDPYILQVLYNYIKSDFNSKYDIIVKGHEVELYIEDVRSGAVTNGIYSLKKDKWVKEPIRTEIMSYDVIETDEYQEWYNRYLELKENEIEDFINDLYLMRKESLAKNGEWGTGNLVFKEFRNSGILQDLKDRKYKYKSKELTLEGLNEDYLCEDWYKVEYDLKGIPESPIYVFGKDVNQVKQAWKAALQGLYRRDKEDSLNHKLVDKLHKEFSNIMLKKVSPFKGNISTIGMDFILTTSNRALRQETNKNILKELQDPTSKLHKQHYDHLLKDFKNILVHHKDGGEGRDYNDNFIIASYNNVDLAHIAHKYCHMKKNTLKKGDIQNIPLADPATGNNYLLTLTLS